MKKLFTFIIFILVFYNCKKTIAPEIDYTNVSAQTFEEINTIFATDNGKSWGFRLNSPILLIDTVGRKVFTDIAHNGLKKQETIYTGDIKSELPLANGILDWSNKTWTAFILPLPTDPYIRNEIIIEELFSQRKKKLGLDKLSLKDCKHLLETNNRVWIKIEAEALKNALKSDNSENQKEHIRMAISARKMRKLYNGNKKFSEENKQNLKLGIPKLAGILMSGRTYKENCDYLYQKLNEFQQGYNFSLTFPTTFFPCYGLLISNQPNHKIKYINSVSDIDYMINRQFDLKYSEDFNVIMNILMEKYRGEEFKIEEENRIKKFKTKFIESPCIHLKISNETAYSYNPVEFVPYEDKGIIYRQIQINDKWGSLTVLDGALLDSNYIYISTPFEIDKNIVKGAGWEMTLNKNYDIRQIENGANYSILSK